MTDSERRALASDIQRMCQLRGEFRLRSGIVATQYFDKYLFESDPTSLRRIARALLPLIPSETEVLAGLELGGVPVATALSLETGLPAAFVRKQRKLHGTGKLAEGAGVDSRRLLIVEDIVTTGGQISLSTTDLRAEGALVAAALCVLDRNEGGRENLREFGIELISLFTVDDMTGRE